MSQSSVLESVRADLVPGGDSDYFAFHRLRFESHLAALRGMTAKGSRVLDVGSHYLHLSSAFANMGMQVTALDVAEFQRLEFVKRRAERFAVRAEVVHDLGMGDFLPTEHGNSYDAVVFCEILEHITFNPIRFWRRIYDLLKPGGFVYLSTPNSLRLTNVLRSGFRLGARRGVGIPLDEIFGHVTFGHHWKEYSAPEIVDYFTRLSPDFQVTIRFVDYELKGSSFGGVVKSVGGVIPSLRPHLEAVVRVPTKTAWSAREKGYDE